MKNVLMCVVVALLAGCSPQAALLSALVPDGTTAMLLSQVQRVEDANRRTIAELEQKRDWPGLARFAEENIKRDAHTPDWWLVAGYAYTQQEQHVRAAECYAEAVRLEPDVSLPWQLLAQSYRSAGQPQRAVTALNRALLARRDDAQLYWLLGEAESDLQRWHPAMQAYRAALKIDAENRAAWYGLGHAALQAGRAEEARVAVRMLDRLDPALAARLDRSLR